MVRGLKAALEKPIFQGGKGLLRVYNGSVQIWFGVWVLVKIRLEDLYSLGACRFDLG